MCEKGGSYVLKLWLSNCYKIWWKSFKISFKKQDFPRVWMKYLENARLQDFAPNTPDPLPRCARLAEPLLGIPAYGPEMSTSNWRCAALCFAKVAQNNSCFFQTSQQMHQWRGSKSGHQLWRRCAWYKRSTVKACTKEVGPNIAENVYCDIT